MTNIINNRFSGHLVDRRKSFNGKSFTWLYNCYRENKKHSDESIYQNFSLIARSALYNRPFEERIKFYRESLLVKREHAVEEDDFERLRALDLEILDYHMHILG